MVQFTVSRRHLVVFTAVIAMFVSVAWVGVASRASAASSTPVVYVATGENFPDALGAAAAAAVQGGPVLLVQKDSIPAETAAELARLSPEVIYVSGGTAVVSDATFNALKAYAPSVVRVAGANRYATAVEVSKSAFPATGGGDTAALEARIAALEALLAGMARNGDTLLLSGMNLQVVNGEGSTATSNKVGNIIIGYNEQPSLPLRGYRDGSHYLIVGSGHTYGDYGGIVVGKTNRSTAPYASVFGGNNNMASGSYASVAGGSNNTASGYSASVSGGSSSTASGPDASVSGGYRNIASGDNGSVTGGRVNTASGSFSSVVGGYNNTATGSYSSVVGGDNVYITSSSGMAAGEGFWNTVDS